MAIVNNLIMQIDGQNIVVYPNTVGRAVYINESNGYNLIQALEDLKNNTVSEWSQVRNKPFISVGSDFRVIEGQLRLNGSLSMEWNDINNKPQVFNSSWTRIADKPESYPCNWNDIGYKPRTYPAEWDNILNKPNDFTSSWEDVKNKPNLFPTNWNLIEEKPDDFGGTWNALKNKPFSILNNNDFYITNNEELHINNLIYFTNDIDNLNIDSPYIYYNQNDNMKIKHILSNQIKGLLLANGYDIPFTATGYGRSSYSYNVDNRYRIIPGVNLFQIGSVIYGDDSNCILQLPQNSDNLFANGSIDISYLAYNQIDFSKVSSANYMFQGCQLLNNNFNINTLTSNLIYINLGSVIDYNTNILNNFNMNSIELSGTLAFQVNAQNYINNYLNYNYNKNNSLNLPGIVQRGWGNMMNYSISFYDFTTNIKFLLSMPINCLNYRSDTLIISEDNKPQNYSLNNNFYLIKNPITYSYNLNNVFNNNTYNALAAMDYVNIMVNNFELKSLYYYDNLLEIYPNKFFITKNNKTNAEEYLAFSYSAPRYSSLMKFGIYANKIIIHNLIDKNFSLYNFNYYGRANNNYWNYYANARVSQGVAFKFYLNSNTTIILDDFQSSCFANFYWNGFIETPGICFYQSAGTPIANLYYYNSNINNMPTSIIAKNIIANNSYIDVVHFGLNWYNYNNTLINSSTFSMQLIGNSKVNTYDYCLISGVNWEDRLTNYTLKINLNNLYQGTHYFNDATGGVYITYNYETSYIEIRNTNNNIDISAQTPVKIIINNDVNLINFLSDDSYGIEYYGGNYVQSFHCMSTSYPQYSVIRDIIFKPNGYLNDLSDFAVRLNNRIGNGSIIDLNTDCQIAYNITIVDNSLPTYIYVIKDSYMDTVLNNQNYVALSNNNGRYCAESNIYVINNLANHIKHKEFYYLWLSSMKDLSASIDKFEPYVYTTIPEGYNMIRQLNNNVYLYYNYDSTNDINSFLIYNNSNLNQYCSNSTLYLYNTTLTQNGLQDVFNFINNQPANVQITGYTFNQATLDGKLSNNIVNLAPTKNYFLYANNFNVVNCNDIIFDFGYNINYNNLSFYFKNAYFPPSTNIIINSYPSNSYAIGFQMFENSNISGNVYFDITNFYNLLFMYNNCQYLKALRLYSEVGDHTTSGKNCFYTAANCNNLVDIDIDILLNNANNTHHYWYLNFFASGCPNIRHFNLNINDINGGNNYLEVNLNQSCSSSYINYLRFSKYVNGGFYWSLPNLTRLEIEFNMNYYSGGMPFLAGHNVEYMRFIKVENNASYNYYSKYNNYFYGVTYNKLVYLPSLKNFFYTSYDWPYVTGCQNVVAIDMYEMNGSGSGYNSSQVWMTNLIIGAAPDGNVGGYNMYNMHSNVSFGGIPSKINAQYTSWEYMYQNAIRLLYSFMPGDGYTYGCFNNCNNLIVLELLYNKGNVYSMGNGCLNLPALKLPYPSYDNGSINYSFNYCPNLRVIDASRVLKIQESFTNCFSIETIYLNPNLTSLAYSFGNSTWSLRKIVYNGTKLNNYESAETMINRQTGFTFSFVLAEPIYSDGNESLCFAYCYNLQYGICGEHTQYMNYTYEYCYNLSNINIGDNVIGMHMTFGWCYNLQYALIKPNIVNYTNTYFSCNHLFEIRGIEDLNHNAILDSTFFMCSNLKTLNEFIINVAYLNYTFTSCPIEDNNIYIYANNYGSTILTYYNNEHRCNVHIRNNVNANLQALYGSSDPANFVWTPAAAGEDYQYYNETMNVYLYLDDLV